MRSNYDAPTFGDLLRMLRRSEGVSPETTEKFLIHQHMADGSVHELMAHDSSITGATLLSLPPPIKELKPKPPVVENKNEQWVVGGNGRYFAKEV